MGKEFSETEKIVIIWQLGLLEGFHKALWEAICQANDENLIKLSFSFPEEVTGYLAWTYGNLASRLRTAGLEI